MARRLRFNGTGSGGGSCPSVHEDLDTGEVIVHGPRLTDPEDIAQLQHLDEDEIPIVVPRNTLIDFVPKKRDTEPRILDPDTFARLFENFQHSAWHLEMRRRYTVDEQTDTYAQFVRGEKPAWDMDSPWARTIGAKTRDGAAVGRVRIVDSPPSEGQLYLLEHAAHNADLGEDIRSMWRDDAKRANLPDEDFWIFDSHIVALCLFDEDDNLTGAELITEPARVNQYNRVRDIAVHYAIPYTDFVDRMTAKEE
ncbi:DUF6879 family protein [Streptomyces sp. WI04-05B]|uniref:DUF6879 family protein n=1 Tax=Streptomyces TaxID=1883 RepID=UPI0029B004FF|nr:MULTISPECIES: DUF6879 family protein [unclassified Streptomyces]MDX2547170.1 hypothetical protein [Streptomyces sp. WI04-05B]MDX2581992.1 hypothetical protein [Streptomyces sp. WI04-05A]